MTLSQTKTGMDKPVQHTRILLKLSGEALVGDKDCGIDLKVIQQIIAGIKEIYELQVEIAIVIGGGNIFRGADLVNMGLGREVGDYIGMLGTVINALAMQDLMEKENIPTRLMSAVRINQVCEEYIRRRALRHLERRRVVIFAAGTGNPFFTTDTAASLRAAEISADLMIKATRVKGVYDSDPEINEAAVLYDHLSYDEMIGKGLAVMDTSAVALCKENNIPFRVLDIFEVGALSKVVRGGSVGTLVS